MIQFEDALTKTLANLTNLKPNKGQIRVAYADESAPSWKHTDDVICFYLTPVSGTYGEDSFEKYTLNGSSFNRGTTHTQIIEVNFNIYGPHCRELADLIRILIRKSENRSALTAIKAFPVSKAPTVNYVPYGYNQQWWQRADMTLTFNWQTDYADTVNTINSATIGIYTDKGDHENVNITP